MRPIFAFCPEGGRLDEDFHEFAGPRSGRGGDIADGRRISGIDESGLFRGLDRNQQCVANLAAISRGISNYAQDYDQRLPLPVAFSSIANFKSVVGIYVIGGSAANSDTVYRCPANGNAYYTLNTALGGLVLASLPDGFYSVEAARDSKPHPDSSPNIGFIDGHVERSGVDQTPTNLACRQNAHSVGIATLQYSQDYDERYPLQPNDGAFRDALFPYTKNPRVFVCPDTKQFYTLAQSFRGKPRYEIPDLSKVALLQDSIPHKNGIVTTGYLDGYVEQRGPDGSLLPPPPAGSTGLTGQQISLRNFKQLGSALSQYTQDYDERLPVYNNYHDLLQALTPYLPTYDNMGAALNFDQPSYEADPMFSGIQLASIESTADAIYLRDVYDFGDRFITAGYLDGHVKRIPRPPQKKAIKVTTKSPASNAVNNTAKKKDQ